MEIIKSLPKARDITSYQIGDEPEKEKKSDRVLALAGDFLHVNSFFIALMPVKKLQFLNYNMTVWTTMQFLNPLTVYLQSRPVAIAEESSLDKMYKAGQVTPDVGDMFLEDLDSMIKQGDWELFELSLANKAGYMSAESFAAALKKSVKESPDNDLWFYGRSVRLKRRKKTGQKYRMLLTIRRAWLDAFFKELKNIALYFDGAEESKKEEAWNNVKRPQCFFFIATAVILMRWYHERDQYHLRKDVTMIKILLFSLFGSARRRMLDRLHDYKGIYPNLANAMLLYVKISTFGGLAEYQKLKTFVPMYEKPEKFLGPRKRHGDDGEESEEEEEVGDEDDDESEADYSEESDDDSKGEEEEKLELGKDEKKLQLAGSLFTDNEFIKKHRLHRPLIRKARVDKEEIFKTKLNLIYADLEMTLMQNKDNQLNVPRFSDKMIEIFNEFVMDAKYVWKIYSSEFSPTIASCLYAYYIRLVIEHNKATDAKDHHSFDLNSSVLKSCAWEEILFTGNLIECPNHSICCFLADHFSL